MIFNMPVKVYEEDNCVKNHSYDIINNGKKFMIVTGKFSAKKNGSLKDVEDVFKENNKQYIIFDEVEENPSLETVIKAKKKGLENDIDCIIAIGGGSPIDAAKAIAIMIANPNEGTDFLFNSNSKVDAIPVIAIPTTCGTGSEVTGVSVLTVHEKNTKVSMARRVFPIMALIDAKYLETASQKLIVATAIDALGHMVESYINTNATDFSKAFVREGLSIWKKSKAVLSGERIATIEDYRNLMLASMYAGMAIAHTGTTLPHSLSYSITYELGVAHGLAIGYFIPGYLGVAKECDRMYVLDAIGFASIEEFVEFYKIITECEKLPDDIINKVVETVGANETKLKMCPFYVDKEVLMKIANWMFS